MGNGGGKELDFSKQNQISCKTEQAPISSQQAVLSFWGLFWGLWTFKYNISPEQDLKWAYGCLGLQTGQINKKGKGKHVDVSQSLDRLQWLNVKCSTVLSLSTLYLLSTSKGERNRNLSKCSLCYTSMMVNQPAGQVLSKRYCLLNLDSVCTVF